MNEFCRAQLIRFKSHQHFHLRCQLHFLGTSRRHAAALRNQALVVIVPARALQFEQSLALLPAFLRVGVGIEKYVPMIEGGDELCLF